eukprot:247166-Chlamydomonas_euryale.AAC.1
MQVISSKQRPRKLTICGSDGAEYMFLLKGHEDLRQDERVMQVGKCGGGQVWTCGAGFLLKGHEDLRQDERVLQVGKCGGEEVWTDVWRGVSAQGARRPASGRARHAGGEVARCGRVVVARWGCVGMMDTAGTRGDDARCGRRASPHRASVAVMVGHPEPAMLICQFTPVSSHMSTAIQS